MIRFKSTIFLRGLFMGTADLIPGVSGGTIALITGIYERLLSALASLDMNALQLLIRLKWKKLWKKIDGNFLLSLFTGILTAVFALAKTLHYLLTHFPVIVYAFFFGLILASSVFILKQSRTEVKSKFFWAATGAVAAYFLTGMLPEQGTGSGLYLFFSGIAASMAMILPGISGSYILVILGSYLYVLEAVHQLQIPKLAFFTAGVILGLLGFSKLLKWFFTRFKNQTLALMGGFLIGSLRQIWPWKLILEKQLINGKEIILKTKAIWPWDYPGENYWLLSLILFLTGIGLILFFEKIQRKYG